MSADSSVPALAIAAVLSIVELADEDNLNRVEKL